MTGWKQAYTVNRYNVVLVELEIPDDAKITHVKAYGFAKDFYRTDRARVVSITSLDGRHSVTEAASMKDPSFFYKVGEIAIARNDRNFGKTPGICFFKTRQQALDYDY